MTVIFATTRVVFIGRESLSFIVLAIPHMAWHLCVFCRHTGRVQFDLSLTPSHKRTVSAVDRKQTLCARVCVYTFVCVCVSRACRYMYIGVFPEWDGKRGRPSVCRINIIKGNSRRWRRRRHEGGRTRLAPAYYAAILTFTMFYTTCARIRTADTAAVVPHIRGNERLLRA